MSHHWDDISSYVTSAPVTVPERENLQHPRGLTCPLTNHDLKAITSQKVPLSRDHFMKPWQLSEPTRLGAITGSNRHRNQQS